MQIDLAKIVGVPAHEVFVTLADIVNWPRMIRAVRKIELLTPGPVRQGTRFRQVRTFFGRERAEEMEVQDFEPPRRLRVITQEKDVFYELDHLVDALHVGSRISLIFRAASRNVAGKAVLPLMSSFIRINLRDELEEQLGDLAAAVHARAQGGPRRPRR